MADVNGTNGLVNTVNCLESFDNLAVEHNTTMPILLHSIDKSGDYAELNNRVAGSLKAFLALFDMTKVEGLDSSDVISVLKRASFTDNISPGAAMVKIWGSVADITSDTNIDSLIVIKNDINDSLVLDNKSPDLVVSCTPINNSINPMAVTVDSETMYKYVEELIGTRDTTLKKLTREVNTRAVGRTRTTTGIV